MLIFKPQFVQMFHKEIISWSPGVEVRNRKNISEQEVLIEAKFAVDKIWTSLKIQRINCTTIPQTLTLLK